MADHRPAAFDGEARTAFWPALRCAVIPCDAPHQPIYYLRCCIETPAREKRSKSSRRLTEISVERPLLCCAGTTKAAPAHHDDGFDPDADVVEVCIPGPVLLRFPMAWCCTP